MRRLQRPERRGGANTKLTDVGTARGKRENEDIFRFGEKTDGEVEIDVTRLSSVEAAETVKAFVEEVMSKTPQPYIQREGWLTWAARWVGLAR